MPSLIIVKTKKNIIRIILKLRMPILKVAFFRKCDVFFKSPKKYIPKNYPELEI